MNNPHNIDHHDEAQEEILFPSDAEAGLDFEEDEREDNFRDDVEADADALASAGFGTDEDYGGCHEME